MCIYGVKCVILVYPVPLGSAKYLSIETSASKFRVLLFKLLFLSCRKKNKSSGYFGRDFFLFHGLNMVMSEVSLSTVIGNIIKGNFTVLLKKRETMLVS